MSASLAITATALETAAGVTTSTNPNEPGYWRRIAAASETLAGATTSANATTSGYMLRAALALESIAGTSGVEENANHSGYMKRIVDALEVQSGAIETGSLEHRLVLGAQNAIFNPYGPNLVLNGTFPGDDATGWTVSRVSITGEKLALVNTSGFTGHATYTFPDGLEDGVDHLVEWDVSEFVFAGGATRNITLGGTNSALPSASIVDGHFSVVINAGAATEVLRINSNNNDDYKIKNVSVREVL